MTNRNLLSATLAVLLTGSCAMAEEHVATVRWSELEAAGKLETGEIIRPSADSPSSSEEELLIVNEAATPLMVHLATIDPTGISKFNYTVSGRVRYENVEQPGYLEMWSVFPDNSRYFSKTLSASGPTGTISWHVGFARIHPPVQQQRSFRRAVEAGDQSGVARSRQSLDQPFETVAIRTDRMG
jgi:hypothetical protein